MNITTKFHNFVKLLQISFKCTDGLWNACLHADEPKQHYFCQVKTATQAVHWLTKRLSFRKVPISITKMKNSHSVFIAVLPEIFTLTSLPRTDTSHSLQATECTVNRRTIICTKNSRYLLNVWSECNSEIVQINLQFDADSHLFTNQFFFVQFA
jgi:hypothetical protein